jgi:integrase
VWLSLGDAQSIGLADARRLAAKVALAVAEGKDPSADRKAERLAGSFADVANQYVELHAKRRNKSWRQADALVRKHLLPRWGKLKAQSITRADVRALMLRIEAPIVANQTLAAASVIFSWAIRREILTVNPCRLVDRNPTRDRERILSDVEVAILWPKLDSALKLILLTGQRPGEVAALDPSHLTTDGWWQLPGRTRSPGAFERTRPGLDRGAAAICRAVGRADADALR